MRGLRNNAALGLCCLGLLTATRAAELKEIEVSDREGVYQVSIEVVVAAPLGEVWGLVSDPRNLARLSPGTRESFLLPHASKKRLRVVLHPCLLIFCRDLVKISDVDYLPPHRIRYTAIPGAGDFDTALETLEFTAHGDRTLMHYDAVLDPAFPVPNLLGSWLIEKIIGGDLRRTAGRIEELAHAGGRPRNGPSGATMYNR